MTKVDYTAEIDGEARSGSFVVDDVNDPRAGWDPEVALAYAQHFAVDQWGYEFDVNNVDVQIRDDHSQYDEEGGMCGPGL